MNKSMPWQPPMSLTEEPMHGAPHAATLLNDDTRVVKQDFTTLGHLFINPTINIDGGSAILGNLDVCKLGKCTRRQSVVDCTSTESSFVQ